MRPEQKAHESKSGPFFPIKTEQVTTGGTMLGKTESGQEHSFKEHKAKPYKKIVDSTFSVGS